jgi:hypothetical protein
MTDALAVNDIPRRTHHGRGFGIPANLCRAKVAREPKPPPAPAARIEVTPIVQPSIFKFARARGRPGDCILR